MPVLKFKSELKQAKKVNTHLYLNDKTIFSELINSLSPCDSSLEQACLKAVYNQYELCFYGDGEEEFSIDCFGYAAKDDWHELTPTAEQLKLFKQLIKNEMERLYRVASREEADRKYQESTYEDIRVNGLYGFSY